MRKVVGIIAVVPADLIGPFMQHVRDFDAAHPNCEFVINADGGSLTIAEMEAVLKNIDPPFASITIHRKQ